MSLLLLLSIVTAILILIGLAVMGLAYWTLGKMSQRVVKHSDWRDITRKGRK